MLFPKLLLFFFAAWCLAESSDAVINNSDNVIKKSFTADCSSLENGSGTCNYSVVFSIPSTSPYASYGGSATFSINGQGAPFSVDVSSSTPFYKNFEVSKGDKIVITFEGSWPYAISFKVYNGPDGTGSVIIDSISNEFHVVNPCESTCSYNLIVSSFSSSPWPEGAHVTLTVSSDPPQTYTYQGGTSPVNFSVNKGEMMYFQFTTTSTVLPDLSAMIRENGSPIFIWYYGAYYSPMTFVNPCTKNSFPSPFGGDLYPITAEEIEAFIESAGFSAASDWIPASE